MSDALISFLLDRTGSMEQWKDDVIGGFNQFLKEQKEQPGECRFVLTLFDSQSIDTTDYKDVREVPELTHSTYQPRASTPLLDAIAKTILATDALEVEADRILFVVYTDGYENASHEHTRESVKAMVTERERDQGWDFVFLGADIDAWHQSQQLGFAKGQTFSTSGAATGATMTAASSSVSSYRQGNENWTKSLEEEEERQKTPTS